LLILSDIQYKLTEREDLVDNLQTMLKDNFLALSNPAIPGKKSNRNILTFRDICRNDLRMSFVLFLNNYSCYLDIVKCRLACLMSVYYDKLFWKVEDLQVFEQMVMLVFSFLESSSVSVQIAAIDSLDSMYFDEEYSQRLIATIHSAI